MDDNQANQDSKDQGNPAGTLIQQSLTIPFPETFIYSNVSAFSISMMDVHISFAEALPDRSVVARVGVAMTPEHAAHVALSLFQQLAYFETNFGPIRNPAWRSFVQKAIDSVPLQTPEGRPKAEEPESAEPKPDNG